MARLHDLMTWLRNVWNWTFWWIIVVVAVPMILFFILPSAAWTGFWSGYGSFLLGSAAVIGVIRVPEFLQEKKLAIEEHALDLINRAIRMIDKLGSPHFYCLYGYVYKDEREAISEILKDEREAIPKSLYELENLQTQMENEDLKVSKWIPKLKLHWEKAIKLIKDMRARYVAMETTQDSKNKEVLISEFNKENFTQQATTLTDEIKHVISKDSHRHR
jgi:hypothetical protein